MVRDWRGDGRRAALTAGSRGGRTRCGEANGRSGRSDALRRACGCERRSQRTVGAAGRVAAHVRMRAAKLADGRRVAGHVPMRAVSRPRHMMHMFTGCSAFWEAGHPCCLRGRRVYGGRGGTDLRERRGDFIRPVDPGHFCRRERHSYEAVRAPTCGNAELPSYDWPFWVVSAAGRTSRMKVGVRRPAETPARLHTTGRFGPFLQPEGLVV